MIAGAVVNIGLWPIYTSVHGPGSVDQEGEVLGMGTLFLGQHDGRAWGGDATVHLGGRAAEPPEVGAD